MFLKNSIYATLWYTLYYFKLFLIILSYFMLL